MMEILKSATKLSLLGLVLVIVISTLAIVFTNLKNDQITVAIMSVFTTTVGVVIGYYFRRAEEKSLPVNQL